MQPNVQRKRRDEAYAPSIFRKLVSALPASVQAAWRPRNVWTWCPIGPTRALPCAYSRN
jgi:hypothetical protein